MSMTEEAEAEKLHTASCSSSDGEFSDPLCVDAEEEDGGPMEASPSTVTAHPNKKPSLWVRSGINKAAFLRRWLTFYVKFAGSAGNQDKLLKILQWSLWLMAHTGPSSFSNNVNTISKQQWMSRISDQVSWARYVTRLLGFPVAVEAALTDSWTLDKSSPVYRTIGKLLAYSMVGYHPTEMVAYLQWQKPAPPASSSAVADYQGELKKKWWQAPPATWSYISCRFWLVYIAAELTQCILQWRELRARKLALEEAKKQDSSTAGDKSSCSIPDLNAQLANVQLQTVRNALFLLPCIHWSLPKWDTQPWLRPYTVNALMWGEAVVSLYQAIQNQLP